MLANGSEIGSPAPMQAALVTGSRNTRSAPARSTLVNTARLSTGDNPDGTVTTTRGCPFTPFIAFRKKYDSIASHCS